MIEQNKETQEYEFKYYKLDTSKLVQLMKKDLNSTSEGTAFLNQHKKEDIMRYLQSPISSEKIIRQISRLLYNLSPQYKRLLHYLSDMGRYDHIVDISNPKIITLSKEKILDKYLKTIKHVDIMNIKHEFSKITKTIFVEDIFFGYDYSTDHSYYIQKLNPDYCRISGVADGIKTFEFDFSYFRGRNEALLDTLYGSEFKEKYELYKSDAKNYRWQELSLERSICIKLNEELEYPIPFFASIFPDIFDINDYKLLKKSRTELDNYILLVGKIPYLKENGVANNFGLELGTALEFGNKIIQQLPDQVAFLLSPYEKIDDIQLGNKNQVENNTVAQAEKSFYDSAGVNQAIFNSEKITEESIRKSIQSDENIVFGLYRQYERWINRKLKLTLNDDFKVRIINTTEFNYGEVVKRYKETAIYGIPVVRELCASLGMSPLEMECSIKLESDVLGLYDRLKPLTSSNTLSPDKVNGRPPQDATGAGDTGKKLPDEE